MSDYIIVLEIAMQKAGFLFLKTYISLSIPLILAFTDSLSALF